MEKFIGAGGTVWNNGPSATVSEIIEAEKIRAGLKSAGVSSVDELAASISGTPLPPGSTKPQAVSRASKVAIGGAILGAAALAGASVLMRWLEKKQESKADSELQHATPPVPPAMNESPESQSDLQPLNDGRKARWFFVVQQRHQAALMHMLPGSASEAVIAELEEIQGEYDRLLEAGPPDYPLYSLDDVRQRQANVLATIGRMYDSLRDGAQARYYLEQAVLAFEALGDVHAAEQTRDTLAQVRYDAEGDVDAAVQRLQGKLEGIEEPSLEHAMGQLALGEAYMRGGDDLSAENYLLRAQAELEELDLGDPSAVDPRIVLVESLQALHQGTVLAGTTRYESLQVLRGAYQRLYQCLSIIYRDREELDQAGKYSERLRILSESEIQPAELASIFAAMQPVWGENDEDPAIPPGAG
jgi:tetratricopeptide (TPR) repeat protein